MKMMFPSNKNEWNKPPSGRIQVCGQGFTLIEIMVVMAIIGLLAGIAGPQWFKYRNMARVNCCIANLRQINHAKAQWAFDTRKNASDTPVMSDLVTYIQNNTTPVCPADGVYTLGSVGEGASCSLAAEGHTL